MDVVCASLKALIKQANPHQTYWVTKDRNPPENALRKYHLLAKVLHDEGYSHVGEGTDPFGRHFWTMRRNTD